MSLRKAAEMALEALENPWEATPEGVADAIQALRQALAEQGNLSRSDRLAQPEQKLRVDNDGDIRPEPYPKAYENKEEFEETQKRLMKELKQREQEPEQRGHCTCGDPTLLGYVHFRTRPCIYYTAPPKREWVGLTDDEIAKADCVAMDYVGAGDYGLVEETIVEFAKAIEAKLKEKNT